MKAKYMLPVAVLALVLIALLGVNQQVQAVRLAAVPTFFLQTVETGSGVGDWSVTRLDSSGAPHMIYYDANQKALFYVKHSGTNWTAPLEVDAVRRGHILPASDMGLLNGLPVVVYSTDTNLLFYAPLVCGPNCAFVPEQVMVTPALTAQAQNPVMALDGSGNPQILFRNQSTAELTAVIKTGANAWTTEHPKQLDGTTNVTVDAANQGAPISLVRASSGTLKAAYYGSDFHLYYIERNSSGNWRVPFDLTANSTNYPNLIHNGNGVSIDQDSSGGAHVGAVLTVQGKQGVYMFGSITCDTTTCTFNGSEMEGNPDPVDPPYTPEISGLKIKLDSGNFPRMTYYYRDGTGLEGLRYMYYDSGYKFMMIDARVGVGRRSSLAITSDQRTIVSYYGGSTTGGLLIASQGQPFPVFDKFLYLPVIVR